MWYGWWCVGIYLLFTVSLALLDWLVWMSAPAHNSQNKYDIFYSLRNVWLSLCVICSIYWRPLHLWLHWCVSTFFSYISFRWTIDCTYIHINMRAFIGINEEHSVRQRMNKLFVSTISIREKSSLNEINSDILNK